MNPENPENPYAPQANAMADWPLILSRVPMRGAEKIAVTPDQAMLFTDGGGQVHRLSSYPGWRDRSRYQFRYVVDLARRHSVFKDEEVPCQTNTASFMVTLEVTWGVMDPAEVVRTGTNEGLRVIQPGLTEIARSIGNNYPIGEFVDFERHLNREFANQPPRFEEGVGIYRCKVQVRQDDRYKGQIFEIDDEKQKLKVTELRGGWVDHIDSPMSILKQYLKQDPEALPQVVAELQRRAAGGDARAHERFTQLLESEKVQDPADFKAYLELGQESFQAAPTDLIEQPRLTAQQTAGLPPSPPAEEEDVMPAELVPEDGVADWVDTPWARDGN